MYNLELIQLSPPYPRAKSERCNYNIIPSIQSQVPFLEIKNPIPPMRENFITHDYNTKHAKSSKEKNQINYNNHIIYEEQINEELDQSFGVGFDIENFMMIMMMKMKTEIIKVISDLMNIFKLVYQTEFTHLIGQKLIQHVGMCG
ncbi:hypothetical protein M0813_08654 [Anaeramoeba flamelloides]|uniref:Uncharacterized protein n=1 Tax=Anaeramoeba flamelloides TaxID=1746091 RepID=A0ABQ8X9C2_9EUKA|nr:hypothetical protein M0813_08654 [Anaeramoeba flamelloides]